MKAIVVGQYGVEDAMHLKDIPEPVPGPGEVLIALKNAGVNPNETYVLTGTYAFYTPDLPFTLGFDGAGIIDAVGEGVTEFKPGDRVYMAGFMAKFNSGTYAQKVRVSVDAVQKLPDNIDFAQGAALGIPAAAAYRAVYIRGEVKPGETVLVHGASGGVGLLAIQMAKAVGAIVIGTAGSDEGKKLILEQGADHAIDHLNAENLRTLRTLTDGRGPDVIIEFLANKNLAIDMEVIAKYGRIVVIGNRGSIEVNPRMLMAKDSDIRGLGVPNFTPEEYRQCFVTINELLTSGKLSPVVGRHFTLEEAKAAHKVILDQKTKGKLVFDL